MTGLGCRPRTSMLHGGVVRAHGLWFMNGIVDDRTTQKRVLESWRAGATLYHASFGWVLLWHDSHDVSCSAAAAAPLTQTDGLLLAGQVERRTLREIGASPGTLVLPVEGRMVVTRPGPTTAVDPSEWLNVSAFQSVDAIPLADPPPPPALVAEDAPSDIRAILAEKVGPRSAESKAVVAALRSVDADGARPSGTRERGAVENVVAPIARGVAAFVASIYFAVVAFLGGRRGASVRREATSPLAFLREWLARMAMTSRLFQLIGRRQATYLRRVMEMFERRDFEAALRHAIPLGGPEGLRPKPPALGTPSPRASLSIVPGRTASTASMVVGGDLFEHLRRLYRAAFERLDEAGRTEEAAFVLAELLDASEEAVAYLERKGRLQLAAEMAEARELPPGLVVRQWFVARDPTRAFLLARRTGAFADAIARLERHDDAALAEALRLGWADLRATAGDYLGAADIARSVEGARALILEWLGRAIDVGGVAGAAALAVELSLDPLAFQRRSEELRVIARCPDRRRERDALAARLLTEPTTDAARVAQRMVARAIVADAAEEHDPDAARVAHRLAADSRDGPFGIDLRALPRIARLPDTARHLAVYVDAADRGALPIHDCVLLPRGRMALALGEIGVRVVRPNGETTAYLDAPAHRLVRSEHDDRLLALARRGDTWKVSRCDLVNRRVETWCEADLDAFAETFDGEQWIVATHGDLAVVDVLQHSFRALRRVPDIPGRVSEISRGPDLTCSMLVVHSGMGDTTAELWRFDTPSWILRARTQVDLPTATRRVLSAFDGRSAAILTSSEGAPERLTIIGSEESRLDLDGEHPVPRSVAFGTLPCVGLTGPSGARVVGFDRTGFEAKLDLHLLGSSTVRLRADGPALVLVDDLGRLLRVDMSTGRIVVDLRIRLER